MKRLLVVLLLILCLTALPMSALAADITLYLSASKAETGDEIIASGMAAADTWISLKGTDADGDIVYFSAVTSDASGSYSEIFKVPEMDGGILTVFAGNGSNTVFEKLSVHTRSSDKSGDKAKDKPTLEESPTPLAEASAIPASAVTAPGNAASHPSPDASTLPFASPLSQASASPFTTPFTTPSVTPSAAPSATPSAASEAPVDIESARASSSEWIWAILALAGIGIVGFLIVYRKKHIR